MDPQTKTALLARLRGDIAKLEKRPMPGVPVAAPAQTGVPFMACPAGVLHEVWTDHFSHSAGVFGFTLGQIRGLLDVTRHAVIWLQIAHEGQEYGMPHGAGLAGFGLDPAHLILGRTRSITDLLWAGEEAAACPAVAAVIADIGSHHKALDFTASRRLGLRAEAAGASIFLMRYGGEREASAASFRWHVTPQPSAAMPFDNRAPGHARWQVTLEKGLGRAGGKTEGGTWTVDWTDNGFALAPKGDADGRRAALPGAASAALGDRLPETA
ncbi:hypothetical protein [Breoghania sp. L-A4]|uniref:ImuA family protein n=1 Tax=Breoghania sp. L-A4 TaxID=2304600 RepID=UPI000E35FD15|nr:hypothetical protein [Breoghania sp. L-A4]AXS41616.1 hypothetical protein D1F64_18455 [Breoghania sp. L-A4]